MADPIEFHTPQSSYSKADLLSSARGGYFGPGNAQLPSPQGTLKIIADVGYASAYSFKYSTRPGTPGANLGDQIEEAVKNERLWRLQNLVNAQAS